MCLKGRDLIGHVGPASHRPLCGLNTYCLGVPPCRWPRTARLYRGMSLAQTPPGLPLTRRLSWRGSLAGGNRRGSTLPAEVRQAERRCPRERDVPGSRFGPHPMAPTGTHRSPEVSRSAGLWRPPGETGWVKSADKDAVPGSKLLLAELCATSRLDLARGNRGLIPLPRTCGALTLVGPTDCFILGCGRAAGRRAPG